MIEPMWESSKTEIVWKKSCCIFSPAFGCCALQTLVEILIFIQPAFWCKLKKTNKVGITHSTAIQDIWIFMTSFFFPYSFLLIVFINWNTGVWVLSLVAAKERGSMQPWLGWNLRLRLQVLTCLMCWKWRKEILQVEPIGGYWLSVMTTKRLSHPTTG